MRPVQFLSFYQNQRPPDGVSNYQPFFLSPEGGLRPDFQNYIEIMFFKIKVFDDFSNVFHAIHALILVKFAY
jgi:hypothetical protein